MGAFRLHRHRLLVRAVGAVLAATGLVAVSPGPVHAAEWWETSSTAGWYDGQVSYSQVLNCFSVIQGSPYYEAGVGAYVGYLADPQSARPAAGDKGWIRFRVYGMATRARVAATSVPASTCPPDGLGPEPSDPVRL